MFRQFLDQLQMFQSRSGKLLFARYYLWLNTLCISYEHIHGQVFVLLQFVMGSFFRILYPYYVYTLLHPMMHKHYTNFTSLYRDTLHKICFEYEYVNSPRGNKERELIGFNIRLDNPPDRFCLSKIRKQNIISPDCRDNWIRSLLIKLPAHFFLFESWCADYSCVYLSICAQMKHDFCAFKYVHNFTNI